jgi:hypothetical protein
MQNMKTTTAIALLGLLGLLAGCSTSPSEPAPAPGVAQKPVSSISGLPKLGAHVSDVAPKTLFPHPVANVVRQLVQTSSAVPPTDVLDKGLELPVTTHTDLLRIAPMGVAATYQVPIDTVDGEAYLFLGPQTDDRALMDTALRDIVVLDPAGVPVGRVSKGPQHGFDNFLPMSAIPLAGHPVGNYTVQFKSGSPKTGLAIDARLSASNIVMSLAPSTLEHLLGNESTIDATLVEGGVPITGAHVVAQLVDGETGAPVAPMSFVEVGSGVYRATLQSVLTGSNRVSAYLADVTVDGTSPKGLAFLRHGRTGFHFGVPSARLNGVVAQRTLTDTSGMITAFEVDVALESVSLDRLEITGKLTTVGADGLERPVSIAQTGDAYDAGNHVVTLHFDAGQLRLTRAEGNFMIRNLSLYSLGTDTLFHRDLAAGNTGFAGIARTALKRLPELTPGQRQLVNEGALFDD